MNRLVSLWKKKSTAEKILSAVGIVCSVSVIVLAVLQLVGVWENAGYAYLPLIAVLMLIQTVQYWRQSKPTAILSLCAAVLILMAAAIRIFFG